MIEYEVIEDYKDCYNRKGVNDVRDSGEFFPAVLLEWFFESEIIGDCSQQCTGKGESNQQVSEFAENKRFANIIDVHSGIRLGAGWHHIFLLLFIAIVFGGALH